mmetsp:Transcript_11063/g.27181  ORF Transcript_11063/g.27181 Transcript_11063/m.27181 type:complete len:209 (-) Transcript_11063:381-1007(-)
MRGVPYDSALAEFESSEDRVKRYVVMRLYTNKTSPMQPSLSLSTLAAGWIFGTPGWAKNIVGFSYEGKAHVLKHGEVVGKFIVVKKTQESIVFAKKTENLDMHVGVDLVKASASEGRDKYYACYGVLVNPKTSTGEMLTRFYVPIQIMMMNVMLKFGARYAQDLYGGSSVSRSISRDQMMDAVYQKQAIKDFKKGKRDDMGEAETANR